MSAMNWSALGRMQSNMTPQEFQELDTLCDDLQNPNLRGFLVRIPQSKFYRYLPNGRNDCPSDQEIKRALIAARLDARARAAIAKARGEG